MCVWLFETILTVRLLRPWDFPGKNIGTRCHFLPKGIFSTWIETSSPCGQVPYLSHQGSTDEFNFRQIPSYCILEIVLSHASFKFPLAHWYFLNSDFLYYLANKGLSSQSYCFSSSLVWMWELDNKESWMLNNWCFWTMVLEKTLESPFNFKEIQPVYPKGNQHWTFIGRTDAEAETPTLWAPDVKKWLTGKDPDAGKDWRREEKGTAEDEMVRWHHWLDQHESEQAPGVDDGQGSLACCSPRGHKESDMTEWLNWTEFLGFNLSSYFSSVCFLAIVLFGLHLSVY